jgi:predicted RNase H-like HicB family nuclease
MTEKYRIVLTWSEASRWWIAEVPELPYTAADGATPEEAIANVHIDIQEWLATARQQGMPIPAPRSYEDYGDEEVASGYSDTSRATA